MRKWDTVNGGTEIWMCVQSDARACTVFYEKKRVQTSPPKSLNASLPRREQKHSSRRGENERSERLRGPTTQQNAAQVSWLATLPLRRVVPNVCSRETRQGHRGLGNALQKGRGYQIYGMHVVLKSKSRFLKNLYLYLPKIRHGRRTPLSEAPFCALPSSWGAHSCVGMREAILQAEGAHNLKAVWPLWKSVMRSGKLFCLDDPIGQNGICSFATVIYSGSSIILNRLPFI